MGDPPPLPPPPDPRMLPVFATVTYAASVIALWGFLSLGLDADAIAQRDAGPLLGPAMVLGACLVTLVALLRVRGRSAPTRAGLAAAASVYIVMLGIGAVGYSLIRADVSWLVLFVGAYGPSPFVLGAALLSGIAVVAVWAGTRRV
ncbi:DUF6121 family protein [Conyzicola sp.]|uniref:DUF6121 family protein n=1 Tax=Conyzicola sp. TaxID=1969404 RepID=UPI003989547A